MQIEIPFYIQLCFILTIIAGTVWFYFSLLESGDRLMIRRFGLILLAWIILQTGLSLGGFYSANPAALPPPFLAMVIPPLLLIAGVFVSPKGRAFIDRLSIWHLTLLHVVRIPVEIVLYWLFLEKAIPEVMTFAGRNWDILAGISAPFVVYFLIDRRYRRGALILWNILSLLLLLHIIVTAVLSAPLPFQQFGLDQPNLAIFYFPICFLPALIVPMVLFSHLAALRLLVTQDTPKK